VKLGMAVPRRKRRRFHPRSEGLYPITSRATWGRIEISSSERKGKGFQVVAEGTLQPSPAPYERKPEWTVGPIPGSMSFGVVGSRQLP
jgi:hypothetical protein